MFIRRWASFLVLMAFLIFPVWRMMGTAAKKVQNGLYLRADYGSALFLSLFLVRGFLNRGIPDTRFHVL